MAKIEVEESELVELRRVSSVANLIGKNPKARPLLQQAVAMVAPEQIGPEHHLRTEFSDALASIREDLAKDREERAKEREERETENAKRTLETRWQKGRQTLRDAGYDAPGIEAVEKLMESEEIANHEAAAALYERRNPPPLPIASSGSSRWNFFDAQAGQEQDAAFKALMDGNDEAFLAHAVPAALKGERGG